MLPYSREVYFSLFAQLNTQFALFQFAGLALALYLAFELLRPKARQRPIPLAILAALWAGCAYFWFYRIFAEIHFLAPTYAILAGAQALCLALAASLPSAKEPLNQPRGRGSLLLAIAFLWFLLDLFTGPGWPAIRIAGLHPAPLLFLTLVCLLHLPKRSILWLGPIPFLLSAVCAYQAYVLKLPQDWLPLLACGYTVVRLIGRQPWSIPQN